MIRPQIRLLINADDYGLTKGICEAIIELLIHGCISNTTALMCSEGSIDLQTEYRRSIDTRLIGVHLQLTGGIPIVDINTIAHRDPNTGGFRRRSEFAIARPSEVYNEWKAQIELFCTIYGHKPSHLDSHHGPHRERHLFPVYARLAQEYGVPVRSGDSRMSAALSKMGVDHMQGVLGNWTGHGKPVNELVAGLKGLVATNDTQSIEVVTHPGFVDADLMRKSTLNSKREKEYYELRSVDRDWWSASGFYLIKHGGNKA